MELHKSLALLIVYMISVAMCASNVPDVQLGGMYHSRAVIYFNLSDAYQYNNYHVTNAALSFDASGIGNQAPLYIYGASCNCYHNTNETTLGTLYANVSNVSVGHNVVVSEGLVSVLDGWIKNKTDQDLLLTTGDSDSSRLLTNVQLTLTLVETYTPSSTPTPSGPSPITPYGQVTSDGMGLNFVFNTASEDTYTANAPHTSKKSAVHIGGMQLARSVLHFNIQNAIREGYSITDVQLSFSASTDDYVVSACPMEIYWAGCYCYHQDAYYNHNLTTPKGGWGAAIYSTDDVVLGKNSISFLGLTDLYNDWMMRGYAQEALLFTTGTNTCHREITSLRLSLTLRKTKIITLNLTTSESYQYCGETLTILNNTVTPVCPRYNASYDYEAATHDGYVAWAAFASANPDQYFNMRFFNQTEVDAMYVAQFGEVYVYTPQNTSGDANMRRGAKRAPFPFDVPPVGLSYIGPISYLYTKANCFTNVRVGSAWGDLGPDDLNGGTDTDMHTQLWATYQTYDPVSKTFDNVDAGHIRAKSLGGTGTNTINIFPQLPSVNRGVFNQWERIIVGAVNAGCKAQLLWWWEYGTERPCYATKVYYCAWYSDAGKGTCNPNNHQSGCKTFNNDRDQQP